MDKALRKTVVVVAALNLAYFGIEFTVARAIGSVALFADSIDFLEDASINILIAIAIGWTVIARARLGMGLAVIIMVPGLFTLFTAWQKFMAPLAPEAFALSITGAGAMAVNLTCAFLLVRFRNRSGSMARAAFLSARNDVIANIAIVVTGLVTAGTVSGWPDLVVGLAIAALNADAAFEVWEEARKELKSSATP